MAATDVVPTRRALDWRAVIWSTIISGLLFAIIVMLLAPVFRGGTVWSPVRMIAGIVMGQGVVPPPDTFDFVIVTVGVLFHMALALVYVVILALIIQRMTMGMALVVGAVAGFAIYLINFYGFSAMFPWWVSARDALGIFSHLAFGISAAWAYKHFQSRDTVPVRP